MGRQTTGGANSGPHRVAFFANDGVTLLDIAGRAEVFTEANRFGADYRIVLLSPTGEDVTSTTVRRRVETLIRDQAIRPAAEVDLALLGASAEALLWMTVEPGGLTRIAHALCSHPGVRFVAATTGASNLLVAVADLAGLYAFLTETVGAPEQIKEIETTPILHTVSRTGIRRSA